MSTMTRVSIIAAASLVCGCADTPSADADYGRSVRQMIAEQTYDPMAASYPPEHAPEIGDGARLQNALDLYRKDVAKGGEQVKAPIVFEVAD